MNNGLVYSEKLVSDDLSKLFNDEVFAIVIRKYVDPQLYKRFASQLVSHPEVEKYFYEVSDNGERKSIFLGVSRLGVSFSTTFGRERDGPETKRYYLEAQNNIERIRRVFEPYVMPMDKLKSELDELYPYGANLASFENKKMFHSIVRITHHDLDLQEKNPHVDSLPPNYPLQKQFSANIYLETPDEGGELVIYPMSPLSAEDVDDFEANQKLWEAKLPEGLLIRPESGDLIIINTRRPHAVKKFSKGLRVSLQTFIGYNHHESLKMWC